MWIAVRFRGCVQVGVGRRERQVETVFGGGDGADDLFSFGFGCEATDVYGCELETVEESLRFVGSQASRGKGVDDDGDCELDGFGVFERVQLDVVLRAESSFCGSAEAIALVAFVQALMEEAVVAVVECR